MPATGRRLRFTSLTALVALVALAAPTLAAPPPPPLSGPPPGAGSPPPPLDDPSPAPADAESRSKATEPSFARLASKRFRLADASTVELRFLCNSPFEATVRLATGQRRSLRSTCTSDEETLTSSFGAQLKRRLRAHGSVRGTLAIRMNGRVLSRSRLTVTGERVTVTGVAGAAQGPSYWDGSQAWFRCANLYNPTTQTLNLRWHTYNGSVRWIYWRVWMQTYWNDPQGYIKGMYWKSPAGWWPKAASPLYGPYRMNGYGIVEFQQNQGGAFSNDPWIWYDDVLLGYNMYARAWAELWVWNGSWSYASGVVPNDISTAEAPGWCWNT